MKAILPLHRSKRAAKITIKDIKEKMREVNPPEETYPCMNSEPCSMSFSEVEQLCVEE